MVKYNQILRLPILSVALFSGLMFYLGSKTEIFEFEFSGQTVLSALLFTAGLVLIAMAGRLFRKASTTVNPLTPEKSSQLVTSGLYRFSRNPMYIGFLLWLIAPEERALEALFGANYLAYKQNVRRWV